MPTAKFNKEIRNSYVDKIFHKGKSPEKCAPGAANYENFNTWRYTKKKIEGG